MPRSGQIIPQYLHPHDEVYINDNTVYYSNPADETMQTYETYQRNYVGS